MKGIILAGGSGTRLHPTTRVVNKHLLPVFDEPMVHYPLATLVGAGLRDVLIITTPRDLNAYQTLLGDGSAWGVRLQYLAQPKPGGLAEAFIVGRDFVGQDDVVLALGDNLFHGPSFHEELRRELDANRGATIFGVRVHDPTGFAVARYDASGAFIDVEEKPEKPASDVAIVGLYAYDNDVLDLAASLPRSSRGELEITDLNRAYLAQGKLRLVPLGEDVQWFDAGTPERLLVAAQYVAAQRRQGVVGFGRVLEAARTAGFPFAQPPITPAQPPALTPMPSGGSPA